MSTSNPLHILIADDEDTFRLSVKKALVDFGYRVTAVDSGEEAILVLDQDKFDVVVLDYKMSGISGLNVMHHMHEQKDETPVIILTGAGTEDIAVEVLKMGAYDYVRKEHLELRHLPIVINGVHERFLFRKEKVQQVHSVRDTEQLMNLLESFQAAIGSLSHVVNNSLALLSLNIREYSQILLPHVEESAKDTFRAAFRELDKEYNLISTAVKTMMNLSAAMQDKVRGGSTAAVPDIPLFEQIELLKKDFENRMRE